MFLETEKSRASSRIPFPSFSWSRLMTALVLSSSTFFGPLSNKSLEVVGSTSVGILWILYPFEEGIGGSKILSLDGHSMLSRNRATKSPSSPHHKFSSLTIFVGVAQPFGSSRESLNVIDLCIFLKLFGNANYLQLPALFQKDHSPNLFLSEFRGFFSLSQQNRYNRQK